uniref:Uncharacterized protein n=1 Tax=candidate division WOR-3 bacterium TaxID=2052148 RepID=A0A7V3PSK4_UNCW3
MLLTILLSGFGVARLSNICNSAPAPQGNVVVNVDCFTQDRLLIALNLLYSTDDQQSWTSLNMNLLGTPGYESTYTAQFQVPAGGNVYYYLRAESPAGGSTLSPFNTNNSWPPPQNLLALANNDPVGDANAPEGNWLDLTGCWVGYSSDRFYAMLTNNYNSWPLYSFPQPWYIYSVGFVNPEASSDTYVFALAYANIPAVFTTGLYLINRYTGDFSRIADIDAQTNGNRLYLRALINDFVNHPKFGPWPNNCGYLAVAANTQSVYPIGGNYLRDTTIPAYFYAGLTPVFTIGANYAPVLSAANVNPRSGPPGTKFLFSVRYQDDDNNLPTEKVLIIDSRNYTLVPNGHYYQGGVIFREWLTGFDEGWHRFYFQFSDGMAVVTTPLDSFYVGSTGLNDAVIAGAEQQVIMPTLFNNVLPLTNLEEVVIYNSAGHLIRKLSGVSCWDGCDEHGNYMPAGVYYLFPKNRRAVMVVKIKHK